MFILTHRGLDPSKNDYFLESSLEAFSDQVVRGFGLEFDLQITRDNRIIISHDSNLSRISGGKDKRLIKDVDIEEIKSIAFDNGHLAGLDEMIDLLKSAEDKCLFAIHIKSSFQKKEYLDILLKYIIDIDSEKVIFFDLKIETAKYLREKRLDLKLAASVAHTYDIRRFNLFTGGTLLSIPEVINNRQIFDWVWLDEWDRIDEDGRSKKFYTAENFNIFRQNGFKIALVTPELHRGSPGLLANEKHEDAEDYDKLFLRIQEIISLRPDAICTDYPDKLSELKKE